MKKRLLALVLALLTVLPGCRPATAQHVTGFYFDTVVIMTVYAPDDAPLKAALEKCAYYENLLSKTVEGSDVWRINHANGERVQIEKETRAIIEKALEYSRLSDGKFDITIAPCVALWDFHEADKARLPDPDKLAAAAKMVDYTLVDVNDDGVKLGPGQSIDLGGIAKGYVTAQIALLLKEKGVKSGLLNFGGNIQTIGSRPDGSSWGIGVKDPQALDEMVAALPVTDGAVVTSGIYERGFQKDGVWYHHLLDPKTGMSVQNGLASVTVVAPDSFRGDGLSATLFYLGEEEGKKLAESLPDVEALFITRENQLSYTSGLEGKITLRESTKE